MDSQALWSRDVLNRVGGGGKVASKHIRLPPIDGRSMASQALWRGDVVHGWSGEWGGGMGEWVRFGKLRVCARVQHACWRCPPAPYPQLRPGVEDAAQGQKARSQERPS